MPPEPERPAMPEPGPDAAPDPGLPAALLDEFAGLGSLADRTGRARTSREVASSALETVRHTTGATAGLILFNAGDSYEIAARFGLSNNLLELVRNTSREGSPLAAALEATTEPILVPVDRLPFRREVQEAVRAEGISAVALVGLRIAGKVVGVLGVAWHAKLPGRVAESVLLPAAALVAVALQNALLVERLEETLASEQRLVEEQAALESLTQIGETAEAFDDLAQRTIAQVTELLGAKGAAYVLIQPGDVMRYAAWRGIPDDVERIARSHPASEDQRVRALAAGAGAHVGTFTADGISRETLDLASREGWTAYGVIPIRVGKHLEGIIAVYFDRPLASLRVDERGLDLVGRIASISLANFRLRERLATSEERYRTLFDQSPEALVLLSGDAEVIAANRAALELYRTDVPGLIAYGAIGGPRVDAAEARRQADILSTPGQQTHRRTGSRPDGSTFPQELIVTPLVSEGSQNYLILVRDLTDEERLQGELLQAQKMEALGQLVAGVAHELNNPLASIVAFSQLIRGDERLPQDLRHDAELLKQEADRTRRIVGSLLDFARRRPPERVATSVRTLIESVLALHSYGIASTNISLELDLPPALPPIDVDRSQLQQVLLNLTLNAIQAIRSTGRPGSIAIAARAQTGEAGIETVCLSITDDGPGVEPDVRSRLFLPFFTTREPGEGTGLGLSVSFGIVAAHGGRLWYEPGPGGRGASFSMELPVHSTTGAPVAAPTAGASPSSSPVDGARGAAGQPADPGSGTARPRVLVLDDEPAIRSFLTKVLRLGNFDPIVTQFGHEAIERAGEEAFDVVLVDHRMPGMSGTEVYEAVVAIRPELADRFVFMSGDVFNPELQRFAEGRDIGLLAKPFDIETALRVVGAVVARR